jgi:hypothetical protein
VQTLDFRGDEMAAASTVVDAPYRPAAAVRRGWIESPGYDLGLLSLTPLLGVVVCGAYAAFGIPALAISSVSLFLLGMPHYFSTYAFLFDDTNARSCHARKAAFYLGPFAIMAFLTGSLLLHFYWLVAVVVDVWNVFHVSRQSAGILSIYRHLGGGDNRREKLPANLAIVGTSAGLYAVFVADQPSFHHYLAPFPLIERFLGPALLVLGFGALVSLVWAMGRRRIGAPGPEVLFLGSSLLLFLPYVLIDSRSTASSAMLAGHYVQYLGILWLLNHRKYGHETGGSLRQQLLARASRSTKSILLLLVGIVAASIAVDRVVHFANAVAFHTWVLNLVVLLHFYFDGLFWSFKRREVRDSIAPYLIQPERRLLAS